MWRMVFFPCFDANGWGIYLEKANDTCHVLSQAEGTIIYLLWCVHQQRSKNVLLAMMSATKIEQIHCKKGSNCTYETKSFQRGEKRNIGCDECWAGSIFKSKSFNFISTQLVLSIKDCRFPTSNSPWNIRLVRFFSPKPSFEVMLPVAITEKNHRNLFEKSSESNLQG